jgi:hypothetical protein
MGWVLRPSAILLLVWDESVMRRFEKMTAERVLSNRFGAGIRLGGGEMLGQNDRSEVYRFRILSGPDGLPETVLAKQGVCRLGQTFSKGISTEFEPGPIFSARIK